MQTGNTDFNYRNELDKACFQHDMAYGKSKDLVKRTQSDTVLKDKAFEIASDSKYDSYQRELVSMVYKFFDKKSKGSGTLLLLQINKQMNFVNQLLEIFFKKEFIHLLDTTLGVLI